MNTFEYLEQLSQHFGPSGCENGVSTMFKTLVEPYVDECYVDNANNVYALRKGEVDKTLLLEAHCDQIGLIVRNITKNGFIECETIGGVDRRILPGTRVEIHGKKILQGIIGCTPPHLRETGDKVPKIHEFNIDVGGDTDSLSIGDPIAIHGPLAQLQNGFVTGGGLDNHAGMTVLIRTMELLKSYRLPFNICACCTGREEIGLVGAQWAVDKIRPFTAICVDVCHGTSFGNNDNCFECGKVVLTCGPSIAPSVFSDLKNAAKRQNISISIDVDSGNTGTNAWVFQVANEGVPCGLVSIPLRYMHTPVEILKIDDIEQSARLLANYIAESPFSD